jgi:hypothetical protein
MRRALLGSLVVVLLAAAVPASATTTIAWTHQFGSSDYDVAWGIAVSGTDAYVAGWTLGALPGQTNAGGADGFLRRLDASGNEVWTIEFGTRKDDYAFPVAMDATGLYVLGATYGTFAGQTKLGGGDGFLAKFDTAGNELWTVQFGTAASDFASNVVADATGVYVIGNTLGTFPGATRRGREDVFVSRFDGATGAIDWTTQLGTRKDEFGYANALGPAGLYVNGFTDGTLPGERRAGDWDAFVGLLGTDGSLTWLHQFGTAQNDQGYGIVADASGVFVSGDTRGAFPGYRDRPGLDAFVTAFDPAGTPRWLRQFGTRRDDTCWTVSIVGTDVECAGTTTGAFKGQTSAGGFDGFVKPFDTTTAETSPAFQFGTRGQDFPYWSASLGSSLYLVGQTAGRFPGQTRAGGIDAFAIRLDVTP